MSPRLTLLALPALLAACATAKPVHQAVAADPVDAGARPLNVALRLPGEEVLAQQPAIPPLPAFQAPVPEAVTLPNGLTVLVVQRSGAPIQALSLVVKRGAASDPAGQGGLASLTAAMLEAGSAGKSPAQIAAQADALGAELRVGARTDSLTVSISAQPSRLEPMARLLAEVALRPNFDPAEFKKVHARRLAQLQDSLAEPRVAAGNAMAAALYGDGPLGHAASGVPATVKGLTLAQVKALWAGVSPGEAALVAVGSASKEQVVALATALLGGWKGPAPRAPPAQATVASRPRLVLVELPGRPQTVLQVGQPGVPLTSPDAMALRLANAVLGGSFTSRLMQNLREQHGYTYGAGSSFAFGRGPGPFTASSSVKTEVTGAALKELLGELQRIAAEPLPEAELAKGKALLAFSLVELLQRAELTAGQVGELFAAGAPLDSLQTYVPRLQALDAAGVQAALQRALDPATMTITLAGDPKVLEQLAPAGLTLPAPQKRTASGTLR